MNDKERSIKNQVDKIEILAQLKILSNLPYTNAYKGSLENLTMSSYVSLSDINNIIKELKSKLKELEE